MSKLRKVHFDYKDDQFFRFFIHVKGLFVCFVFLYIEISEVKKKLDQKGLRYMYPSALHIGLSQRSLIPDCDLCHGCLCLLARFATIIVISCVTASWPRLISSVILPAGRVWSGGGQRVHKIANFVYFIYFILFITQLSLIIEKRTTFQIEFQLFIYINKIMTNNVFDNE